MAHARYQYEKQTKSQEKEQEMNLNRVLRECGSFNGKQSDSSDQKTFINDP